MMRKSRRFCSRIPSSPYAVWVSKTSAETVATVLQGLQAIWQLVGGLNGGGYSNTISLGTVFAPLAICGLIRLPAAVWISDDYSYVDVDIDGDSDPEMEICNGYSLTSTFKPRKAPTSRTLFSVGLLEPFPIYSLDFHSPRSWRVLLFACMLVLVCVAGLETRATPCGLYTTTPPGFFDMVVCGGLSIARNGAVEGIASGLPFGVAWRNSTSEEMGGGVFYMGEFDGWCKIGMKGNVIEAFMPANFSSFGG
ncbi:hypothetical protein BCON_0221g00110 [Botryotinia convoluta]|uniref:Uncharacterized protein n=1 Tax=Botryotinia convoluta TaxID=54673 RepID=A0A4Z1HJ65_9HELO|nr:hypothetical protein BCON_0221g00110 [Botryotinia convoluta]